ncbi:uncharacterized protein BXZ73DRAFT_48808 [Epithele typhae]|uniref:uncharacterized protein n=1 Tax=Epithele typhae TaxID=378194 RepID=UPI0020075BF8|nr:uncharacterized protein BXZ73DRAFT_48808 [Epithele typhae]KAH9927426.1 hypothetical protein BXZ73DRAFT_48808 [Epithele typhae]
MIGPDVPAHLLAPDSTTPDDDSDTEAGPAPPSSIGPQIPASVTAGPSRSAPKAEAAEAEEEDEEDYAPALPPHLAAAREKRVLGPAMPSAARARRYEDEEDEDEEDVGPMPLPYGVVLEEKDAVQEFMEREERRRKQLEEAAKPKAPKREEWMLVPPSSSDLLGSIDPTKLTRGRQFARTAQPARDADRSLWTETPAERQQRLADEVAGKRRRAQDVDPADDGVDVRKRRRQDEEVRRGVEEHTRKQRGAPLMDQHGKKEKEKKEGEDEPPAFWDHGRDMSLGGRLMDDGKRNKFINEAKGLGDRFGSGKSGGSCEPVFGARGCSACGRH